MATAVQQIKTYRLEPDQRGAEAAGFELALRRRIVGQDEAVKAVADLYQTFRVGLNSTGRPLGTLLFLGPLVPERPAWPKPQPRFCSVIPRP